MESSVTFTGRPQGKVLPDEAGVGHKHSACGHRRAKTGLPEKLVRKVSDVPPLHPYAEKDPDLCISAVHRGQRKLLNTEIEFLTRVLETIGPERCRRATIVYAGSAPGLHLHLLLSPLAFRGVFGEWHLYDDPKRFDKRLRSMTSDDHVKIVPKEHARKARPSTPLGYFDAGIAGSYSKNEEDVIFISDIRTDDTSNRQIATDNELTRQWVKMMRPTAAMVKFRLPFMESPRAPPKVHVVPPGTLVLQTWAPTRSAETRLWVDVPALNKNKANMIEDLDYETRMNTFNQFIRPRTFEVGGAATPPRGECGCYDHTAERVIWAKAIRALRGRVTRADVTEAIHKVERAFPTSKKASR